VMVSTAPPGFCCSKMTRCLSKPSSSGDAVLMNVSTSSSSLLPCSLRELWTHSHRDLSSLRVMVPTDLPGFCCSKMARCLSKLSSSGDAVSKNVSTSSSSPLSCSSGEQQTHSHGPALAVSGSARGRRRKNWRFDIFDFVHKLNSLL
jgi:hypothetical protein